MHSEFARQGMNITHTIPEVGVKELIATAYSVNAADMIVAALQTTQHLAELGEETDWVHYATRYAAALRGEQWAIDEEREVLDRLVNGGGRPG